MKITQYCGRCGCKLELNFGRLYKRTRCPSCKIKIKYRKTKDGILRYHYTVKEKGVIERVDVTRNERLSPLGWR